jgi:hypothetical protein
MNMQLEVFYPVGRIARRIGWSRNRTKRWLVAHSAHRVAEDGRWYTTRGLLRAAFPEDADYIIAGMSE